VSILAESLDYVIGVDTHLHSHTAAVLTSTGAVVASLRIDAEQAGYCRLVRMVGRAAPGKRVWAVEGTRSYGAGLTGHLLSLGEAVGEVDRPKRPARKRGKSDEIDAVRAAREALSMGRLASPRGSGRREALRIAASTRQEVMEERTRAMNQLRALVVSAPEHLAARFRDRNGPHHLLSCRAFSQRSSVCIDGWSGTYPSLFGKTAKASAESRWRPPSQPRSRSHCQEPHPLRPRDYGLHGAEQRWPPDRPRPTTNSQALPSPQPLPLPGTQFTP
jgi:hypothetical protein